MEHEFIQNSNVWIFKFSSMLNLNVTTNPIGRRKWMLSMQYVCFNHTHYLICLQIRSRLQNWMRKTTLAFCLWIHLLSICQSIQYPVSMLHINIIKRKHHESIIKRSVFMDFALLHPIQGSDVYNLFYVRCWLIR